MCVLNVIGGDDKDFCLSKVFKGKSRRFLKKYNVDEISLIFWKIVKCIKLKCFFIFYMI